MTARIFVINLIGVVVLHIHNIIKKNFKGVKMIRHVVMWKLTTTEPETKKEQMSNIKEMLEALVGKIEGLQRMEVAPNIKEGGYDLCLYSEYTDRTALDYYSTHPLHKECQKYIHSVISERGFCDMEI